MGLGLKGPAALGKKFNSDGLQDLGSAGHPSTLKQRRHRRLNMPGVAPRPETSRPSPGCRSLHVLGHVHSVTHSPQCTPMLVLREVMVNCHYHLQVHIEVNGTIVILGIWDRALVKNLPPNHIGSCLGFYIR